MRNLVVGVGLVLALGFDSPMLAQQDDTVYEPGNGVSTPKPVKSMAPRYTGDAMRRRVTGAVVLQCVVDREGVPTNLEIVQPLDEDLDQQALRALRQWRFEPGLKEGKAVLVRIEVTMAFAVRR